MNDVKQNGGDLVAQGSYGCVFRPSLTCKDEIERPEGVVSKVILTKEAKKEMVENNKINKIDKDNIYHLPAPKICDFQEKHLDEPGMENCDVLKKETLRKKKLSLLQYKDGGTSLDLFLRHNFFDNKTNLNNFLLQFYDLIYGLNEMNVNKYIHNDIKIHNIVINPETLKMNYIDFGLSSTYKKALDNLESRYSWGYFAYPLETMLTTKKIYNYVKEKNVNKAFRKIKNSYLSSYAKVIDDNYVKNGSFYTFMWNNERLRKLYINDIHKSSSQKDFAKEIIDKVDVFSLGLVLLQCYVFMHHHRYDISNKPKHGELLSHVYGLIMGMVNPYYKLRFSASQCATYYETNILPLIDGKKRVRETQLKVKPTIPSTNVSHEFNDIVKKRIMENCKEGKLFNPKTGRCVNKYGVVGKKILKKYDINVKTKKKSNQKPRKKIKFSKKQKFIIVDSHGKQQKSKTLKKCPEGKILNPKTRRCIKKGTAYARRIMKQ